MAMLVGYPAVQQRFTGPNMFAAFVVPVAWYAWPVACSGPGGMLLLCPCCAQDLAPSGLVAAANRAGLGPVNSSGAHVAPQVGFGAAVDEIRAAGACQNQCQKQHAC